MATTQKTIYVCTYLTVRIKDSANASACSKTNQVSRETDSANKAVSIPAKKATKTGLVKEK
jgi:hypothetical protein